MVERSDVEFTSMGVALRGWLYRAEGETAPAIVMAHGLSAVKEMFLDDYAAAFADAGFTTLVYDHMGFGASDGEPRQSPSPRLQLQGYRDAIFWLAGLPGVNPTRVGLWGTSFSGAHVIALCAEDLPIEAAVAQVPYLGEGGSEPPQGVLGAIIEAAHDPLATVPATTDVSDGVGVMYLDGAHDWFAATAARRAPRWRNELLVAGFLDSADYRPFDHLSRSRVPLLVVAASNDQLTPPGPLLALDPRPHLVEVVEISGGHFDAYESGFRASSGAAVNFFQRHLAH